MLIGNCSLLARTDDRGGLILPWPRGGGPGGASLGLSVKDAQDVSAARSPEAPIVRTELRGPSGTLEILDFVPRVSAEGRIARPSACIRIVRPLEGTPEVVASLSAPDFEVAALGDGVELRGRDEPPVRVLGELAERAARGVPFTLAAPCAALIVRGALPGLMQGPVLTVAQDCLLRTREAWREFVAGLRLPLEPQQATVRAAVTIKLHEDEAIGAFPDCRDPRALLLALDQLGCRAEAGRFCRHDRGAAAAARRSLDVRDPLSGDHGRDLVASALRLPEPAPAAAAWLEHWAALRGAWFAAVAIAAHRDAESLRAAMASARTVLERRLFDERRGYLRTAADDAAVDLESTRAITLGFFAPRDPRAATHLDAIALAIAHDLGAGVRHRCELAHAQALALRRDEARQTLASVVAAGGPGEELGANVAFVLAAFACSREWP